MRLDLTKFAARFAVSRLTVGELAESCGLKKTQIHKWLALGDPELGNAIGGTPNDEISVSTMNALARMLRCTPADLEYRRDGQ